MLDNIEWAMDNQEWAIKNGQSRIDNQEWTIKNGQHCAHTRQRQTKQKTQHNMCWTPLHINKHK